MHVLVYYLHETFPTVSWCHTLFVPMAVCPKCCTNLYQEREKVPSLENASTTPMDERVVFLDGLTKNLVKVKHSSSYLWNSILFGYQQEITNTLYIVSIKKLHANLPTKSPSLPWKLGIVHVCLTLNSIYDFTKIA